jgi:ABC-type uncharacterized transport system substrate-binding protein
MLRKLRCIAVLAASIALVPQAAAHQVALVLSLADGAYAQFADALRTATAGGGHAVMDGGNMEDGVDAAVLERADLIIAAGPQAANAMATRAHTPTLAVLIGRQQFDTLRRQHPDAPLSAVLIDQPVERHVALIRAVLPDARRVGVVLGPDSAALQPRLAKVLAEAGLSLHARQISTPDELLPALEAVLGTCDALLTLPDPLVSSPAAARALLLTSYRHRRPVFAYSRAYVDAGALAAVYSSIGDIGRDLGEWLNTTHGTAWQLPAPRAPRRFGVAINRQVARALNVTVPDDAAVLEAVRNGGAR